MRQWGGEEARVAATGPPGPRPPGSLSWPGAGPQRLQARGRRVRLAHAPCNPSPAPPLPARTRAGRAGRGGAP